MKHIKITTPDNIDIEYRLAGAGSRVAAATIDFILQITVFSLIIIISFFIVFGNAIHEYMSYNLIEYFNGVYLAFIIVVSFLLFTGYFLICEIVMKGQTIGKKILKLRTIRQNGKPITFIQSIIRNSIRIFIDNQGIGIIMMFFSKEHKRLGDIAGGTIVISENPNKMKNEMFFYGHINESLSQDVRQLDYSLEFSEIQIIKEYFARKNEFTDNGKEAFNSIKTYFSNKFSLKKEEITEEFLIKVLYDHGV